MRDKTRRAQASAADPATSAWVGANAGTGKTHVLTMRILRLLLDGVEPERILALTYTKAAAAEMSARVFARLAEWVTAPDATLKSMLTELLDRAPSGDDMLCARRLFARAIETPGGLKVQTIHAFCERLLQRFPLEAGVPPGFAILDDLGRAALLREAVDATLSEATGATPDAPLRRALASVVGFAAEHNFDDVLAEALRQHEWISAAVRLDDDDGTGLREAEKLYRLALGLGPGESLDATTAALADVLPKAELARLRDVLASGSNSDIEGSEKLAAALAAAGPAVRIEALGEFFLTGKGEPRKSLMTKKLAADYPDAAALLSRAQQRFGELNDQRCKLQVLDATLALVQLANAVMQRYGAAKARQAALDFDDLVGRAASLLRSSGAVEWVLYKLDGGLDHILVDEAQDTSPVQWQVIRALAEEFFSGQCRQRPAAHAVRRRRREAVDLQLPGRSARHVRDRRRRVRAAGRRCQYALAAHPAHAVVPLGGAAAGGRRPHLRRSRPHAGADGGARGRKPCRPPHRACRPRRALADRALPGSQALGALVAACRGRRVTVPRAPGSAHRRHHRRVDQELRDAASLGRPIRAGDILILVRKRAPFAPVMVSALKARGIEVAGADRLLLTEQLAVQDLVALGAFLCLPEDDLSLASVLKSPLFGFDDDDLMELAHGRKGSLWSELRARAFEDTRFKDATSTLQRWQVQSERVAPFEFYSRLLDGEGGRARMLARLGTEAADAIDEFLNLAIAHDDGGAPPSLEGFLAWLREGQREVKRDMEQGRNEVRVMTVHGAKGLEAPIVFLPDTCTTRSARPANGLLVLEDAARPSTVPPPFLWPVKGTSKVDAVQQAKARIADSETEERNRLLYVAMTRARDRLYVAGFEGKRPPPADCWYNLIKAGLGDCLKEVKEPDGRVVLRLTSEQTAKPELARSSAGALVGKGPLPAVGDEKGAARARARHAARAIASRAAGDGGRRCARLCRPGGRLPSRRSWRRRS